VPPARQDHATVACAIFFPNPDLATKHFQLPAGSLAPGDDFFKKLGIDSLQTLEMLSRLENHFGIELPDYEVQGVSDFKTLAERIQSRL